MSAFDVGLADQCAPKSQDYLDENKFQVTETSLKLLDDEFSVTVSCQEDHSPSGKLEARVCRAKDEAYVIEGTCMRKTPT